MADIIRLDGVVGWDITTETVKEALDTAKGDVVFEINSPGGYITEGIAILNMIRAYKKGKTCANISYAASMATQLSLACDEVAIYDNGIFMIHNAQGGVYGDHNEQRKQADLQERMSNMLAQLYVARTGLNLEEIKQMMDDTTYLFGQEATDLGFADYVIKTDSEKNKLSAMDNALVMFNKGLDAIKEEALSVEALSACVGNCKVGASPTVVDDKSNFQDQGAKMAQSQSLLGMLQAKLGLGTDKTELQAVEELEAVVKASTEALDTANLALATQTEANTALTLEVAELKAYKAEIEVRMDEALRVGCSLETTKAMLNASSMEEASRIAIEAKQSNGASVQADVVVDDKPKNMGLREFAAQNKIKV